MPGDHDSHPPPDSGIPGFGAQDPAVPSPAASPRRRGARRAASTSRPLVGLAALVVIVALVAGGAWVGGSWVYQQIDGVFQGAPDYPGPGEGSVTIEVAAGDSATAIGRTLKAAGVVKSVDAFTAAAVADERSRKIQVGQYELKQHMPAADALAVLIDPSNRSRNVLTIPEGTRLEEILELIVAKTDIKRKALDQALTQPEELGLPAGAKGNAEGYLFPATYELAPDETATTLLTKMVARWRQAAATMELDDQVQRLGYSVHELITVASLVEAEANRDEDRKKVARVIYNRLATPGPPTYGMLEIDAATNYAHGKRLGVALTPAELDIDSPYNLRKHAGLPPGPIGAPGEASIRAALEPAEGEWFFYVTTNLATGETKFATTYEEFLAYKAEFRRYCETSEAC